MDPISRVVAAGAAGASGAAAGPALYVDDVFSTYLYDGTSASHTITNGIDLSGEGGMVWIKSRNGSYNHQVFDTERGVQIDLNTNDTTANRTNSQNLTAFNSDGFTLGTLSTINSSSFNYASWTFRKAPGFFDVVTYTGQSNNGVEDTWFTVSHSLGTTPGCIIIKSTSNAESWVVWHRSDPNSMMFLNAGGPGNDSNYTTTFGHANGAADANNIYIRAGQFAAGYQGFSYVAYVFAHDDQSFGANSDEAIIKCGSYTGTGSAGNDINVGFEPQFIITKNSTSSNDWFMYDNMRVDENGDQKRLNPSTSGAELTTADPGMKFNATGFTPIQNNNNKSGETFIYIAIRRPHKPPEAGTDVFDIDKLPGSQSSPAFRTGIVTDMGWARRLSNGSYYGTGVGVYDRLRGDKFLATGSTAVEGTDGFDGDYMNGFYSSGISGDIGYSFKRAAGFFDIVAYTGGISGSPASVTHNLNAVPELMIVKKRNYTQSWWVYHSALGNTGRLILSSDTNASTSSTDWGSTTPTSSVFYIGNNTNDGGGSAYIAYLFVTLPGISKIGSYTGTGNNINVDCGFTAGARFVLIKRSDGNGDWYVWDSTRGIVSGNDPYIELNTSDAEVTNTDYIDPLNAGFTVTSSAPAALNTSGGTYIFLAIA